MSEQICIIQEQKFTKQRKSIFKGENVYSNGENYAYRRIVYLVGAEFKAKWRKKYMC